MPKQLFLHPDHTSSSRFCDLKSNLLLRDYHRIKLFYENLLTRILFHDIHQIHGEKRRKFLLLSHNALQP
jgi:hypothetical protein